jgi:hypothetical protein
LRLRARKRADQENSRFVDDAELNTYINASAKELYDILTTLYSDYFFQEYSLPTTGADTYPLPANFYKLLGVDEVSRGSLSPYKFSERSSYSPYTGSATFKLSYIPVMTTLSNDSDTFDGINGYDEYIVVDAARKMVLKEESDTTPFERELAALNLRINESGQNRDAGKPETVRDVHASNFTASSTRYRIQGSNIRFVSALPSLFGVFE